MPLARAASRVFRRDETEWDRPLGGVVSALRLHHIEMALDAAQRGASERELPRGVRLEGTVGESQQLHRQPGLDGIIQRDHLPAGCDAPAQALYESIEIPEMMKDGARIHQVEILLRELIAKNVGEARPGIAKPGTLELPLESIDKRLAEIDRDVLPGLACERHRQRIAVPNS